MSQFQSMKDQSDKLKDKRSEVEMIYFLIKKYDCVKYSQ
jgi:hypothetical protein